MDNRLKGEIAISDQREINLVASKEFISTIFFLPPKKKNPYCCLLTRAYIKSNFIYSLLYKKQ